MKLLEDETLNAAKRFIPGRLTDVHSWHGHLPFAFWVTATLRPDLFVELGTHRGDSYCGFCQSVKTLALPTRCFAVDTWKGDSQAGYYGEGVYEELFQYHQKNYSNFSSLLRMTFDEALPSFKDGSVDLLHIDGHHTYDDVRHDFYSWLPKMSRNGIVLFHDTQVYGNHFGVWKLFKELSKEYLSFEFIHSNGLGVLSVGESERADLKALFDMSRSDAEKFRGYFKEIGMCKGWGETDEQSDAILPSGRDETTAPKEKDEEIKKTRSPLTRIKSASITKTPKISIIIPAFNHEQYVLEAVQSVIAQTEKDFELILIDDGSTDRTIEQLSTIEDSRVAVYKQENLGAAETINRGLSLAKGRYLAILNSDDIYMPERLEILARFLDENPDIDFVATLLQAIDREGRAVQEETELCTWLAWYHAAISGADDDLTLFYSLLIRNYIVTTSNYFFRREVFEKNNPFDNDLRYCHDYKYLLEVIPNHRLRLIREFLLKYRLHETNTINENPFAKSIEILYSIFSTVNMESLMSLRDIEKRMKHPVLQALVENPVVNPEVAVTEMSTLLDRANEGIAEKNKQIEAADLALKGLNEWIVEKDKQIVAAQEGIRGLQEHIKEYADQVRRYENKLSETNAYAVELQGVVKNLNTRLMEMNERLRVKSRELEEIHRRLKEALETIALKEAAISAQEAAISAQEATISAQEALINQKNQLLNEIFTSRGWIWLMRLRRVKRILNYRNWPYFKEKIGIKIHDLYQLKKEKFFGRPKIVHVIANMLTGGSSQLVADLIEYLGHLYDQEVITLLLPSPPAYSGFPCQQMNDPAMLENLPSILKEKDPAILHIHYWGECDEPWYRLFFEAARDLPCAVIENINTPVAPYRDPRVDRYVFVSHYAMNFDPPFPGNSSVIYPGSDFKQFTRKGAPIPDDVIGMVYRLEPDKLREDSIDVFIEVVKRRPQTKCHIVGGGTFLDEYQNRVDSAGLKHNFTFTGYIPYTELPEHYKKMSVFVAPVWKESFGQVSPFAMNMELPIAGYDVGALSEILGDKKYLGKSTNELSEIICDLLDNRHRRIAVGKRNKLRAQKCFSVERMIDAYRRIYKRDLKVQAKKRKRLKKT